MKYKVIVYVPVADADRIRQVIGEAGGGKIGKYDFCSFSVKGTGRFRPMKGSNPAIGEIDKMTEVDEERIEVVVGDDLKIIIEKIKQAHPYEEPAIEVSELYEI